MEQALRVRVWCTASGWSLAVNGQQVIVGETFHVVDGVRDELLGLGGAVPTELREVADAIRRALRAKEQGK